MKELKQEEMFAVRGHWELKARHIITGEVITLRGENLIVTAGKTLLAEMITDQTGFDTGLTYQAIGTNATAPNIGNTTLGTESARQPVTSKTFVANEASFSTFFTAAQSTYNIKEAGVFGHSTATGTLGTGVLFSHWLVSFDNSGGLYDLTFTYIVTIG